MKSFAMYVFADRYKKEFYARKAKEAHEQAIVDWCAMTPTEQESYNDPSKNTCGFYAFAETRKPDIYDMQYVMECNALSKWFQLSNEEQNVYKQIAATMTEEELYQAYENAL